jgi:hypothetical protein
MSQVKMETTHARTLEMTVMESSSIWTLNLLCSFTAKLGDTKELEDFIADLDRTLASEYMHGVKKKSQKIQATPLIKC